MWLDIINDSEYEQEEEKRRNEFEDDIIDTFPE